MRARYTAKDGKPEDVEIRKFVDRSLCFEGLSTRVDRNPAKVAAALVRLIDVLAEKKDALSGSEVLAVLGFHDGQLELDDGTPRTDGEWRDYWADAASANRSMAADAVARMDAAPFQNLRSQDESAEEFRARLQTENQIVDLAGPLRPMIDHASKLATAISGCDTVYPCTMGEAELAAELDQRVSEVAELRRESTKRGELLGTIRGVLFGDKFADPLPAYLRRDLVLSIVERIGVKQ
jgi:hypothetical protein